MEDGISFLRPVHRALEEYSGVSPEVQAMAWRHGSVTARGIVGGHAETIPSGAI
ncbi:MAG: hypothetical protein ACUVXD_08275 [Thermodesulfobacteriota bacterium]